MSLQERVKIIQRAVGMAMPNIRHIEMQGMEMRIPIIGAGNRVMRTSDKDAQPVQRPIQSSTIHLRTVKHRQVEIKHSLLMGEHPNAHLLCADAGRLAGEIIRAQLTLLGVSLANKRTILGTQLRDAGDEEFAHLYWAFAMEPTR